MTAVPKPVAEGWWNASTDGFHQLCSPRISCEPAVVLLKTEYDRMVEAWNLKQKRQSKGLCKCPPCVNTEARQSAHAWARRAFYGPKRTPLHD